MKKNTLKSWALEHLSQANVERAKILKRAFRELKQTFHQAERTKTNPLPGHPVPLAVLKRTLTDMGIGRGDIIHVQSSTSYLLNGFPEPSEDSSKDMITYSKGVVDLLFEIVGESGTVSMCTDSIKHGWEFALTGRVFDYKTMPSRRGFISEVFRRSRDTKRSVHPWYNVTVWGKHGEELLSEQEKASPYAMNKYSSWYKLNEMGGKVVLLGKTFDVNSPIHCPEYMFPDEFPRPVFLSRPVIMKYMGYDRQIHEMQVALHAPVWVDGSPTKYSMFLQEKYGIYQIKEMSEQSKIVCYNAKAQFDAICAEMKNNITWYDPVFYP